MLITLPVSPGRLSIGEAVLVWGALVAEIKCRQLKANQEMSITFRLLDTDGIYVANTNRKLWSCYRLMTLFFVCDATGRRCEKPNNNWTIWVKYMVFMKYIKETALRLSTSDIYSDSRAFFQLKLIFRFYSSTESHETDWTVSQKTSR